MEAAKNKSFRKTFKNPPAGNFINESDLGPELTEETCTPELWQELNEIDSPFNLDTERDGRKDDSR